MKTQMELPELMDAMELLQTIWPNEKTRPCLRWFRQHQNSFRPVRIGGRVFFSPTLVKEQLNKLTIKRS